MTVAETGRQLTATSTISEKTANARPSLWTRQGHLCRLPSLPLAAPVKSLPPFCLTGKILPVLDRFVKWTVTVPHSPDSAMLILLCQPTGTIAATTPAAWPTPQNQLRRRRNDGNHRTGCRRDPGDINGKFARR